MRIVVMIGPLGRAAVLAALAGGVAGCSSDTSRFEEGATGAQLSQMQPAVPSPPARVETAQLAAPIAPRPAHVAEHAFDDNHKKTVVAQKAPAAPKQQTVALASTVKPAAVPAPKAAPAEQQVAMVSPPTAQVATPDVGAAAKAADAATPSFRWPARGRVISGSGAMANGQQNDGINLALPEGTPVHAAEDGVVAYAGSELKGYGNLVSGPPQQRVRHRLRACQRNPGQARGSGSPRPGDRQVGPDRQRDVAPVAFRNPQGFGAGRSDAIPTGRVIAGC